jgi:hypothetical protein
MKIKFNLIFKRDLGGIELVDVSSVKIECYSNEDEKKYIIELYKSMSSYVSHQVVNDETK